MKKNATYHYYVEGEDEKSILDALKSELKCIESGKVEKFNVVQNKITAARIRPLKYGVVVVLVYDTDVETNTEILKYNIDFLRRQSGIREVICIPQVKNLEDELKRSCKIKCIGALTNSKTTTDYKRALISCTNLGARLKKCNFNISKFWKQLPTNSFQQFGNDAEKIKIYDKK